MLVEIYDTFTKLTLLDRVLLIILILALLFKAITEIVCWVICKDFNTDKSYKKPCIHLKSGKTHDCSLSKCKTKYFQNEGCKKQKCSGYRTSNYSIEQIKQIYKFPFYTVTMCKWISELSTVLLLIRTLFNTLYTP